MALWFYHAVNLVDPMDNSPQGIVVGIDRAAGNHGLSQDAIRGLINGRAVELYFVLMAWNHDPPWVDQGQGGNDTRYTYTAAYAQAPNGGNLNWVFRTTTLVGAIRVLYLFHIDMPQQHYKKEAQKSLYDRARKVLGM
jgi:hypothetical protein